MVDMVKPTQACVSVIIPYYKARKFSASISESLSCQVQSSFEIIVVDDGRGDGIEDLINSFKEYGLIQKALFVSTFQDHGAAKARNLGLSLASSEYIAFFDVDDIWNKNYLAYMLLFIKCGGYAVSACEFTYKSSSGFCTEVKLPKLINYGCLLQTNPIATPAIIINKSIVGDFYFPDCGHEDYALWLTLTKRGFDIHVLNHQLVEINRTSGSLSSKKSRSVIWHYSILRKTAGVMKITALFLLFSYLVNAVLKRVLPVYRPLFVYSLIVNFKRI